MQKIKIGDIIKYKDADTNKVLTGIVVGKSKEDNAMFHLLVNKKPRNALLLSRYIIEKLGNIYKYQKLLTSLMRKS